MTTHLGITEVFGCSDEELASKIGDLRYDDLSRFLSKLSEKLARDAVADLNRGRLKLGARLHVLGTQLGVASSLAEKIWNICEPFM